MKRFAKLYEIENSTFFAGFYEYTLFCTKLYWNHKKSTRKSSRTHPRCGTAAFEKLYKNWNFKAWIKQLSSKSLTYIYWKASRLTLESKFSVFSQFYNSESLKPFNGAHLLSPDTFEKLATFVLKSLTPS